MSNVSCGPEFHLIIDYDSAVIGTHRRFFLRRYGWVIWIFSTLGFLFSVPGQTMGMAVFTDYLIDALTLSRTELSIAYLVGTLLSALCLPRAGRLFDQHGGRIMMAGSSVLLALMLLYITQVPNLQELVGGSVAAGWCLILLGYFGVRFLGQGVLTSASRNILLIWFVKRRGLVSGLRGIFVSLGFALAPLLIAMLIATRGWQGALWAMASGLLLFGILSWIFVRSSPESSVVSSKKRTELEETSQQGQTLAEVKRSSLFWLYASSLSIHALFGTALTFHIVSIFEQAGRSSAEAFAYFLPAAVCSTAVNLIGGYWADTRPLKPFLIAMLGSFLFGAGGLVMLEANAGYWSLAIGFGCGGGLWGVISNLAFVRYFGTRHLGEVSGLNTALTVSASAVGPAVFSLGLDGWGSYHVPIYVCMLVLTGLLVWASVQPAPESVHQSSR
ncbi:MAG: MFS transporter [Pseudomonadales bacterium]